jgi:hypothetical protein
LGVVATAFLALGLGVGIGGAAVSNYFASSGTGRDGAYAIGTSQWDDSNAKTAPDRVDSALSEHGQGAGKDHSKRSKRHRDLRSDDRGPRGNDRFSSGGVTQHGSNHDRTDPSTTSKVEAQVVSVFTPVASGNGGRVAQSSHPKTTADASSRNGIDRQHKQDLANLDGNVGKGDPGNVDVSQTGTDKFDTRQSARSEATTKQLSIYAPISVWATGSSRVGVTQSNWARSPDTSSNHNRTNRHHNPDQEARGSHSNWTTNWTDQSSASSATTEQARGDGPTAVGAAGDDSGRVHQDNSASAHSCWHDGHGTRQDAGRWQASRPGPDH